MKFVSKISMAALVLVGLAVSFVGCQKAENEELQTNNTPFTGETFFPFPELAYQPHLKGTVTYELNLDGNAPNEDITAIFSDGTTTQEWTFTDQTMAVVNESGLRAIPLSNGWRIPTLADWNKLYALAWFYNGNVKSSCQLIGFNVKEGVNVLKIGYTDPNDEDKTHWEYLSAGSGYFWLDDVELVNGVRTNWMAVRKTDRTAGASQMQRIAKSHVRLVRNL